MRPGRALGVVAAGAGAAAAALGTGLVVERRVVRTRSGLVDADRLGGLRSDPVTVTTGDGVVLHAEVDEVAPYGTEATESTDSSGSAGTGSPGIPQSTGDGPVTMVFVHGYALNLDCWHFQRRYFRGKHRLVLYDQRSHGRSGRSSREDATIDRLGEDLAIVLDRLAPEGPVILVGHSMGGMSVMAYAEQHPEVFGDRVVGAALISTTAGGLRPHRMLGRLIPDKVGGTLGARLVAVLARAPDVVDSARRRGSNIGFLVTGRFAFGDDVPASYVEFVDEMLAGTPFDVLAEFFPHFESHDKYAVLEAFNSVPTTIISGTGDLLTSVSHSRTLAERIPGARLVEAPGAGHMVILERADHVNAALDGLVAEAEHRLAASRGS